MTDREKWNVASGSEHSWTAWAMMAETAGRDIGEMVSEMFEGVTKQDVDLAHRSHSQRPRRGSELRGRPGKDPTKRTLLERSAQIPVWLAFSEILDNILENYLQNCLKSIEGGEVPDGLEVTFDVTNANVPYDPETNNHVASCTILIAENGGGIEFSTVEDFISVGYSEWTNEESVGVWGNGQKMAMCRLGRFNTVGSVHPKDSQGVQFELGSAEIPQTDGGSGDQEDMKLSRNYYHEKNSEWSVDVHDLHESERDSLHGKLVTQLAKVPEHTFADLSSEERWREMVSKMTKIFANKKRENAEIIALKMKDKGLDGAIPEMSATFTNSSIDGSVNIFDEEGQSGEYGEFDEAKGDFDSLLESMVYIPGMLPQIGEMIIPGTHIPTDSDKDLHVQWLIGLREGSPENPGFTMWGNGKMFEESWGTRKGSSIVKLPGSFAALISDQRRDDASSQKLYWKGYLKFRSKDPSQIPWMAPTKWDYNQGGAVHTHILDNLMSCLATPYWQASEVLGSVGGFRQVQKFFSSWDDPEEETLEGNAGPGGNEDGA